MTLSCLRRGTCWDRSSRKCGKREMIYGYNVTTRTTPALRWATMRANNIIFLSYCTFTLLPALSALRQTHACSNSNAPTTKSMSFVLSLTSVLTSGTVSPRLTSGTQYYSLFLQKQTHFSSLNISSIRQHCPSPLSVCAVCVCASVRACLCACVRV